MQHLYCVKMENKDLYLLHNVCIAKCKAVCDGEVIYELETDKFSEFGKQLYKKLNCNYPKFHKMDSLSKLTFLAGEILVSKLKPNIVLPENTALIFANSGSTIDTDKIFFETIQSVPSPAVFVYTLPNIALGELCIRHGIKGETLFLIQQKFDTKQLLEQINALFSATDTSFCIVGWTEYLTDFDYLINLWLVSDAPKSDARQLTEMGLIYDFNLQS
jgi:hypothetical protein